jgi:stress up-regulated protein Nod 19
MLFTSKDGSIESGFHIDEKTKFILQYDLVNYNVETKKVYVTLDMEYVEGQIGMEATSDLLSVTGCKIAEPKTDPNGAITTESKSFPVLVDGTIVGIKGHLHNGGISMTMLLNGKEICTSNAEYDKENGISGMSPCDQPIKVKKGDLISMKSIYDITKHPMRAGMGGHEIIGGDSKSGDVFGGKDLMGLMGLTIAMDHTKI